MDLLDYDRGRLRHLTHFVDSGFLSISLDDYKNATFFQILAWITIHDCIRKWRGNLKPLVTI